MAYKVLNVFPVGENTSVTIDGNGEGLKSDIPIYDAEGGKHRILTVALLAGHSPSEIGKTTTLLIEGHFKSDVIN